jgi:phage gp29-like protein
MAQEPKPAEEGKASVEVRTEIVTIRNDVTQSVSGFVLDSRDEVLARRGAGKGLQIYQDLKRDPHVKGVLRKRYMAVVAREPAVTPASDAPADVAAADLVKAALEGFPFDRYTVGAMDAVLCGYSVGEVIWDAKLALGKTFILPKAVKVRNQRRFKFGIDGNLRLLTPEQRQNGIELPDRKFIVVRYGEEETEDPYGLGLGNALFWPVFFKRKGIEFWFKYTERFGQPTIVGKHPPHAGKTEREALMAAMTALSSESAVAIPEGMNIEFLENAVRLVSSHETLVKFMDGQISEAVLGETLSTNIGSTGSLAASETHNDVRQELTDADCELICDTLNETLVKWIVEINMPGAVPPIVSRDKKHEEDLVQRATRDKQIYDMGFEPDPEYIVETYGGKWTKRATAPSPFGPPLDPTFAEALQKLGIDPARARDDVDGLADQAEAAADRPQSVMIDAVRAALDHSESLQDFQAKLMQLLPGLSAADLAKVLGEAMVVSELQGRADLSAR